MTSEEARLVLGFSATASLRLEDIKSAWRDAAFKSHPDRGGSSAQFVSACLALERLKSDVERGAAPSPGRGPRPQGRAPAPAPRLLSGAVAAPVRRASASDPNYLSDQALLEEAYGQLGYWGRSGQGLGLLWSRMWGRK
jgi:curved DNA-binding protein CbpA